MKTILTTTLFLEVYNVFFRVVDLGVMVPCETILQSVAKEKVESVNDETQTHVIRNIYPG